MRFPDLVPQPHIHRNRAPLALRRAALAATAATLLLLLLRAA